MKCDVVELELSARLDGAGDARATTAIDEHLTSCAKCQAFEARSRSLRAATRLEAAEEVPDLVGPIMRSIRTQAAPKSRSNVRRLVRPAVVFAAGAVAASLVISGTPLFNRGLPSALAKDIPRLVAEASRKIDGYQATFDIVERNVQGGTRRFTSTVDFEAPETFRVRIGDEQRVFDTGALPPSDIVVPVMTLADAERVNIVDVPDVLGRDAIGVALSYREATPLFAYLNASRSLRPFYPLDTVTVSLDRDSFIPLAYTVRPSAGPERSTWAVRHALPADEQGQLFSARARSFDISNTSSGKLVAYRTSRDNDEVVTSYTSGLAWLTTRETHNWGQPTLFGNVSALATPILLGDGYAYYEPGTSTLGRRLSIHNDTKDVYIETNLPRSELASFAESLDIRGRLVPDAWLTRTFADGIVRRQVPIKEAIALAPYVRIPRDLPSGYTLPVAQIVRAGDRSGATIYYRRDGFEPDGIGLRLHFAPKGSMPPPLDPDTFATRVRGKLGRYTPARSELEWIENGTYVSVSATGFDLETLLDVAESLEEPL